MYVDRKLVSFCINGHADAHAGDVFVLKIRNLSKSSIKTIWIIAHVDKKEALPLHLIFIDKKMDKKEVEVDS